MHRASKVQKQAKPEENAKKKRNMRNNSEANAKNEQHLFLLAFSPVFVVFSGPRLSRLHFMGASFFLPAF